MAVQIFNDRACLRIINNGNVILVNKTQIKTVDTIGNAVVRLDIGEGALKNIYIKLAEVDNPGGLNDVNQLRDYIKNLLIQESWATETKQDTEIDLLSQIRQVLTDIRGSSMGNVSTKEPLRIDESQPNVVFKGWALPNANVEEAAWAIQKISRIDNEIIHEWADGDENYDNVWATRYELKYFPSGFGKF